MKRIVRVALIAFVACFVLVVCAVVAFVLLIDPNDYKPHITEFVQEHTDADFTIDGDIAWSVYPQIGFSLNKITLRTKNDAQRGALLEADEVGLAIALLPLFEGHLQVTSVRVIKPQVVLHTTADGRNNWDSLIAQRKTQQPAKQPTTNQQKTKQQTAPSSLATPLTQAATATENQSSFLAQLVLDDVLIEDAAVYFDDARALQKAIAIEGMTIGAHNIQTQQWFDVDMSVRRVQHAHIALASLQAHAGVHLGKTSVRDFTLATKLTQPTFVTQAKLAIAQVKYDKSNASVGVDTTKVGARVLGNDFAVAFGEIVFHTAGNLRIEEGTFGAPHVQGTLNARVSSLYDTLSYKANITLDAQPKAAVAQWVQLDAFNKLPDALTKLHTTLALRGNTKRFSVQNSTIEIDNTHIKPIASYTFATGALVAGIEIDEINLNSYLPATQAPSDTQANQKTETTKKSKALFYENSQPLLPQAVLDIVDTRRINVSVAIGKLRYKQDTLTDAKASVRTADRVARIRADMGGSLGSLSANLLLQTKHEQPLQLDVRLRDVNMKRTLALFGHDLPVGGFLRSRVKVRSKGNNLPTILRHMNGSAQLTVGKGQIEGVDVSYQMCRAVAKIRQKPVDIKDKETTLFRTLAGSFKIRKGTATTNDIRVQSDEVTIATQGTVRLPTFVVDAKTDVSVQANAHLCSALDGSYKLAVPVKCSGALFVKEPSKLCGIDSQAIRTHLTNQAKQALEERINKEKQKAQQRIDAEIEKKKQEAKEQLEDALKGLFR